MGEREAEDPSGENLDLVGSILLVGWLAGSLAAGWLGGGGREAGECGWVGGWAGGKVGRWVGGWGASKIRATEYHQ